MLHEHIEDRSMFCFFVHWSEARDFRKWGATLSAIQRSWAHTTYQNLPDSTDSMPRHILHTGSCFLCTSLSIQILIYLFMSVCLFLCPSLRGFQHVNSAMMSIYVANWKCVFRSDCIFFGNSAQLMLNSIDYIIITKVICIMLSSSSSSPSSLTP